MKKLKEQSTESYEAEINALIWRWGITVEKNNDYVEKYGCDPLRTATFWCMINVPVTVIIPVRKKMLLLFDSFLYTHPNTHRLSKQTLLRIMDLFLNKERGREREREYPTDRERMRTYIHRNAFRANERLQ